MTCCLSTLLCLMIMLFIAGVPTYLCGCDSSISDKCYKYDIVNATVRYDIINTTCRICSGYGRKACDSYVTVTCYKTYVRSEYDIGGKSGTCPIGADSNFLTYEAAVTYLRNLVPENTYRIEYVDKIDGYCTGKGQVEQNMQAGFAIMIVAGVFGLWAMCLALYSYCYCSSSASKLNNDAALEAKTSALNMPAPASVVGY